MYKFRMSIGDWSDDGHGKHEDYIISSNKPVTDVREAHYRIKEVTGIDLEQICYEYDETRVDAETVKKLKALGFVFENPENFYGDESIDTSPDEMARLWLFLLQKADPALRLEIDSDIPNLHFSGFDSEKRHIGQVGYGLFGG